MCFCRVKRQTLFLLKTIHVRLCFYFLNNTQASIFLSPALFIRWKLWLYLPHPTPFRIDFKGCRWGGQMSNTCLSTQDYIDIHQHIFHTSERSQTLMTSGLNYASKSESLIQRCEKCIFSQISWANGSPSVGPERTCLIKLHPRPIESKTLLVGPAIYFNNLWV